MEHATLPPYLRNRYRLVQWLCRDSRGIFYRAHDESLGRDVAVCFLPPERLSGEEDSARFLREARAIARLAHPCIAALYDADREGPWPYLVMEYTPGQDLRALLSDRGPLPPTEATEIIRAVLQALAYAHSHGVVHQNIEPVNIMCTPDGQVKVTHFALPCSNRPALAGEPDAVFYKAPEIVAGGPFDHRTDLYAVGVVLCELLAGRPPFEGNSPQEVLAEILHGPTPPRCACSPDVPPALEHLVGRLLARDPAARYASAEEVLAALPGPTALSTTTAPELSRYAASNDTATVEGGYP